MTKGQFIDLVLIGLNGGKLTDESAIWRRDIEVYLAPAINYTTMQQYYTDLKSEGDRSMSSACFGYYEGVRIDEDDRGRRFAKLPKGVIAMPRNQGVRFVLDGDGDTYKPVPEGSLGTINFYIKKFKSVKFFRLVGKDRMQFWNISSATQKFDVYLLTDPTELEMEDDLPIPAGLETVAIDVCLQFFSGQRQVPADKLNNKQDLN